MLPALTVAATLLVAAPPTPPVSTPRPDLAALVTERRHWCERYRTAPTPKKKAAVFAGYAKAARRWSAGAGGVSGTVTEVETTLGGDRIALTVRTPFGECSNRDPWVLDAVYHVERGTELYGRIEALSQGDIVEVTLAAVRPWHDDVFQEESVCGSRWAVRFTAVDRVR